MHLNISIVGKCKTGKTRALQAMIEALHAVPGIDEEIFVTTHEFHESKDGTLLDNEDIHKFGVRPGAPWRCSTYLLFKEGK